MSCIDLKTTGWKVVVFVLAISRIYCGNLCQERLKKETNFTTFNQIDSAFHNQSPQVPVYVEKYVKLS
jgi:hypothetical protein